MGVVHEVEPVDGPGERRALKVLARTDARARERLVREGHLLARVRHASVVSVVATGEERGLPFIVLELVPGGEGLDRLLARGPVPWRRAVELLAPIARGLEAVH